MKKFSRLVVALGTVFLSLGVAHSTIPNTDDPVTFLGPTLKGGFTNTINNDTAYSLLGEAGVKNFRVGGTLGWKFIENQYLKVSADYLWQRVDYSFFSGNTKQWVSQGSVGAGYMYDFAGYSYDPQVGINGYYSHAPSKTLNTISGTYTDSVGVLQNFVNYRRIAGSNAGGVAPGFTVAPWQGARLGLDLNYDHVDYDQKYSPDEDANGFGGTVKFNQFLTEDVDLSLAAAVRQPYNNYAVGVFWSNVPYFGNWTLGVDGDYTVGKNTLPNTYNVSLSASYFLDQRAPVHHKNFKGDLKGESVRIKDDLLAWTADPAVYLPQVLAITDQSVTTTPVCGFPAPTVIGTIEPQSNFGGTTTFNDPSVFSPSTGLTYSVTASPALVGGNTATVDPNTGVVTVDGNSTQTTILTVTATNPCGVSASTTVPLTISIIG